MQKVYLGDSVYCQIEDGMILLTTENGAEPSNKIYLEPAVIKNLITYLNTIAGMQVSLQQNPGE